MALDTQVSCDQQQELAAALASIVHALEHPPEGRVGVGWDGFLDRIHRVVRRREGSHVVWMERLQEFRDLLVPDQSANAEWQLLAERPGGNAALLAQALSPLVAKVQLIATLGSSQRPGLVVPSFDSLIRADLGLCSCGAHAVTDALEFSDGKLFLGQMNGLLDLSWSALLDRVGRQVLADFWNRSTIVCLTNWTMTPHMTSIWQGLQSLGDGPKWVVIDLAEPSKRSDEDLLDALNVLKAMSCQVLLGMNDRESQRVARVATSPVAAELDPEQRLLAIQQATGFSACVFHRKDLAIWSGTEVCRLELPMIPNPCTLTGAGDHFNAGLVLGLLYQLRPLACLCLGHAVASRWVAQTQQSTRDDLLAWTLAQQRGSAPAARH